MLVQGARRIGKSTIVEEFARREYKSYILIDFSNSPKEVGELFHDISDLNYLFLRLQVIYQKQLYERKSVIVFDEVQLQPLARQAIKHLVKDGRYDYIETGSLISVRSKSKDIIIPSEETKLTMFPMDYEEFRWALGDSATIPLLRATGKSLYYNTMPYAEGKKYYEVDFVIADRHKVSPIEVKSSGYKAHKSLDVFCEKYSDRIERKFLVYTKDYKRENGVDYIPVYMTMFL